NVKFCIINLHGRVFINEDYDCPFRKADEILAEVSGKSDIIIIDFHAEATSEKAALARYLDGRVTAVFGTHTHVQTADERVLRKGTAYITDIGMTGPHDSIIGMREDEIIERFMLQTLNKFEVARNDVKLQGILISLDRKSFKPVKVERISSDLK
ncbi:MAG TPA: metallophosphoesterase, partial [Firmicutes bacterium]|nr:metallophosphoesterase [Bacillota bacterium]